MCYQDIGVGGDSGIVATLSAGDAIAHKHRDAVEFDTIYFYAGVAEIMHVGIESVDVGTIETIVVIAADEYLVAIQNVAEPVHKVYRLGFAPGHREVARMHHDIGLGQITKPSVAAMCIREM